MRKHLLLTALLMAALPSVGTFRAAAEPAPQTASQAVTIQGTVMDENNEPVIGASVVAKGATKNAVATDTFGYWFSVRRNEQTLPVPSQQST